MREEEELDGGPEMTPPKWVDEPPVANDLKREIPLCDLAVTFSPESLKEPPPPREYLLRLAKTGAGVIPKGKVGFLAATGGTGKTILEVQLAIAVATGTTWLGAGYGWAAREARVLLAVAEEDAEEIQRRLHHLIRAAQQMNDEALGQIARNVVVLPLCGHGVALTSVDPEGKMPLPVTQRAEELRKILIDAKDAGNPFGLVVLDPLSRFGGPDVETDNAAATRFVQVVETLTAEECGRPTVLIAAHTRKVSQNDTDGSADLMRGSSGLKDGARFALLLVQQPRAEGAPDLVRLWVAKSNYALTPEPLMLCRPPGMHGFLRVATPAEAERYEELRPKKQKRSSKTTNGEGLKARVLEEIRRKPGSGSALARRLRTNKDAVLQACSDLEKEGHIEEAEKGWDWVAVSQSSTVRDEMVPAVPDGSAEPISNGSESVPPVPALIKKGGTGNRSQGEEMDP